MKDLSSSYSQTNISSSETANLPLTKHNTDPSSPAGTWVCPACGKTDNGNDSAFCDNCGYKRVKEATDLLDENISASSDEAWKCAACGKVCAVSGLFCGFCGSKREIPQSTSQNVDLSVGNKWNYPASVEIVPRGFSSKKHIIVIIAAAVVMAVAAVIFIVLNPFKPKTTSTDIGGIEVAERFLWEQKYEQAVIEFEKVLEIEPMNVDAYLGLAEAYIGLGEKEKALEILRKGLELTGDSRLQAKIDELTKPAETSSSSSSTQSSSTASSKQSTESNPIERFSLDYIDVSEYFAMSDTLSSIADGRIINATKVNDFKPYKSVFLSNDLRLTELDEVFTSSIYCTEEHALVSNDTPELVHNNGNQHVYKATSKGTELIKTSKYPMYVTEDGYIAYYSSRSNSSVTVNVQSPSGNIVSSTTIDGYSNPVGWAYGVVVDRLSNSDSAFSFVDTKGAPFSYHLYTEQIRNDVTGYYDIKYVQYLFYKNGKVVLDEVLIEANVGLDYEAPSCPESLSHLGKKYLRSYNITYLDNNFEVVEYYESNYTPIEGMDGYYIEPEYAAYALVNKENGIYSQLYKGISSANNGLFIATDFDGKKNYLDQNGREVSTKYEDIGSFDGEYSFVLEDGAYYLIDRNVEKILKIEGNNVKVVGNNMFSCIRNRKLYLLNVVRGGL